MYKTKRNDTAYSKKKKKKKECFWLIQIWTANYDDFNESQ